MMEQMKETEELGWEQTEEKREEQRNKKGGKRSRDAAQLEYYIIKHKADTKSPDWCRAFRWMQNVSDYNERLSDGCCFIKE